MFCVFLIATSISAKNSGIPDIPFTMSPFVVADYTVALYNNSVFSVFWRNSIDPEKSLIKFTPSGKKNKYYITIAEKDVCFDSNLNAITCDQPGKIYGPMVEFKPTQEGPAFKICTMLKKEGTPRRRKYCFSHTSPMNGFRNEESFMDLALFENIPNVRGQKWSFVEAYSAY